jgi:hypothetical protein
MRPTHVPLPRLAPTISRPNTGRRDADEKAVSKPKPAKKRSLNEAAHKLGY